MGGQELTVHLNVDSNGWRGNVESVDLVMHANGSVSWRAAQLAEDGEVKPTQQADADAEVRALTAALTDHWWGNHVESCSMTWPHSADESCHLPPPDVLIRHNPHLYDPDAGQQAFTAAGLM